MLRSPSCGVMLRVRAGLWTHIRVGELGSDSAGVRSVVPKSPPLVVLLSRPRVSKPCRADRGGGLSGIKPRFVGPTTGRYMAAEAKMPHRDAYQGRPVAARE